MTTLHLGTFNGGPGNGALRAQRGICAITCNPIPFPLSADCLPRPGHWAPLNLRSPSRHQPIVFLFASHCPDSYGCIPQLACEMRSDYPSVLRFEVRCLGSSEKLRSYELSMTLEVTEQFTMARLDSSSANQYASAHPILASKTASCVVSRAHDGIAPRPSHRTPACAKSREIRTSCSQGDG